MAIVRVKNMLPVSVYDEPTGTRVTLIAGSEFDSKDPFVKTHAWAFETDAEAEKDATRIPRKRPTSVRIENHETAE